MSNENEHAPETPKPTFCVTRSEGHGKCVCGNNHIANCDPAANYSPTEAHHLVCVSAAAAELVSKGGIQPILNKTTWCINDKPNMYAMPLGATTVRHYCIIGLLDDSGSLAPPSFQNIPQHNYDHNCSEGYLSETAKAMRNLAAVLKKAGHSVQDKKLEDVLNRLSNTFKTLLRSRGIRNGGTHLSWLAASDPTKALPGVDPAKWYLPFSMSSTGVATDRPAPSRDFNARTKRWLAVAKKLMEGS